MSSATRSVIRCIAASVLLMAGSIAEAQKLHATDIQGHNVETLAAPETRVVVLIFAATDCPISNRYIPEISRLEKEFAAKGIAFWWVFPNPGDTLAIVRRHGEEYSISTPTLIDSNQELVRMARVTVTPEAAVFAVDHSHLDEVYHGRIDDRYIAFGEERPQAARMILRSLSRPRLSTSRCPARKQAQWAAPSFRWLSSHEYFA